MTSVLIIVFGAAVIFAACYLLAGILPLPAESYADTFPAHDDKAHLEACRFADECEALTPGHILAVVATSPDLASARERADRIIEAASFAVAQLEREHLESLMASPAFGEKGWS